MNNLAILGISEKEQLTYQTILQTGIVSARELSDILSIKRTTVYLYLEQLKQKGFVFEITNQKKKYSHSPGLRTHLTMTIVLVMTGLFPFLKILKELYGLELLEVV